MAPASVAATPRIYVACLASYNAGTMHGEWIDVDQDADEIQAEINTILKASPEPDAEEWAIHDYANMIDLGENPNIAAIAMHGEKLAEHGGAWKAYVDWIGLDYADSDNFEECYSGQWNSKQHFAEHLVDDLGMLGECPENIQFYFDYEAFARDLFMSDYYYDDSTGSVFHSC